MIVWMLACSPEPCADGYGRNAAGACVALESDAPSEAAPDDSDTPPVEGGDTGGDTGEPGPDHTARVQALLDLLGALFDGLDVEVLADAGDGLTDPRDLEINPDRPDELWVVNRSDDSMLVVFDFDSAERTSIHYVGEGNDHWLAQPAALAFGDEGQLGTTHESDGDPAFGSSAADAMGPTLWTTDLDIFDGGDAGHIDMVHNGALSMGMAWDHDTVYWIHDGYHEAIVRYDFGEPHEPGGRDHEDAVLHRYLAGEVLREADVPSHMALDHDTGLLYWADPAGNAVRVLDTNSGTQTGEQWGTTGFEANWEVADATSWVLVEGTEAGLTRPSGLELIDGVLVLTDHAASEVVAFDLDGQELARLETTWPEGTLMGLEVDEQGRLYLVDALAGQVLRLAP